jgi:hypothetical protein
MLWMTSTAASWTMTGGPLVRLDLDAHGALLRLGGGEVPEDLPHVDDGVEEQRAVHRDQDERDEPDDDPDGSLAAVVVGRGVRAPVAHQGEDQRRRDDHEDDRHREEREVDEPVDAAAVHRRVGRHGHPHGSPPARIARMTTTATT